MKYGLVQHEGYIGVHEKYGIAAGLHWEEIPILTGGSLQDILEKLEQVKKEIVSPDAWIA